MTMVGEWPGGSEFVVLDLSVFSWQCSLSTWKHSTREGSRSKNSDGGRTARLPHRRPSHVAAATATRWYVYALSLLLLFRPKVLLFCRDFRIVCESEVVLCVVTWWRSGLWRRCHAAATAVSLARPAPLSPEIHSQHFAEFL